MPLQLMILVIYLLDYFVFVPLYCLYTRLRGFAIIIIIIIIIIHHHQTYHFTYIKTDAHMNSYFPKTIREWNILPNQIIDCDSIDSFQEKLDSYCYNLLIVCM